jgi:hypothetical protein
MDYADDLVYGIQSDREFKHNPGLKSKGGADGK